MPDCRQICPSVLLQSAATKSRNVVDTLVTEPPVTKEDAAAARSAEARASGTGQTSKGSTSAHLQVKHTSEIYAWAAAGDTRLVVAIVPLNLGARMRIRDVRPVTCILIHEF